MKKELWRAFCDGLLTAIVCAAVNNILRRIGIDWFNAYAFAIGFLFAKIYTQQQTIRSNENP